jgi:hypothetical protein
MLFYLTLINIIFFIYINVYLMRSNKCIIRLTIFLSNHQELSVFDELTKASIDEPNQQKEPTKTRPNNGK